LTSKEAAETSKCCSCQHDMWPSLKITLQLLLM